MVSTPVKIAFGYILLIALLLGSIYYISQQMDLLTAPSVLSESIDQRRRTTHQIISQMYEGEIIGQTLRGGKLGEYYRYKKVMKQVNLLIDSLQQQLTDTLQQHRLDTVRSLIRTKENNMLLVLEALKESPTDSLYKQQIDSLIMQQDSILSATHVRRRVVTHHNTYVIHHKPKKFFKRVAEVFSPGKADSTQVNNVVQEEYSDTIDEAYSPVDTIASMLSGIQNKVFQTKQEQMRTLDARINQLHLAGSKLSSRVNQLLENIETDEAIASEIKIQHERQIRQQAAWIMGAIAILAVLLVIVFFVIISRDLTRSNHYRKELEKAKLYAENLLIARERLMLTITHDIKAPAGSIIGYIDLLLRLVNDKRQKFYLTNMKTSAHHLLNLITSLLDYHRLEAGKMDLHPVTFSPYQLFDSIYNSFLPLSEKKGLDLYFRNTATPELMLEGDPFRIRQIAENLLSNALKFTQKGSITLQLFYRGNQLKFCVADTGCGMTLQEQERIFQEFTRLHNAQGQEGFGLGLSITRKLVELLQGEISIESTPGKGSTFTVTMPLPSIGNRLSAPANGEMAAEKKLNLPTVPRLLRILLIDDDRIQLQLTKAMLYGLADNAQQVMEISCCEHPDELFGKLEKQTFDLLFTDIQMPAMDGFQLLEKLRCHPLRQVCQLPVVAITARDDMNEADFRAKGFAGCLHKPFNRQDLIRILQLILPMELSSEKEVPEVKSAPEQKEGYNFAPLIAFSENDDEAAREILDTFIQDTEKNSNNLQKALAEGDTVSLGNIAHKMLPLFTMIEAGTAVSALQRLEKCRTSPTVSEQEVADVKTVTGEAKKVMETARTFIATTFLTGK